MAFAFSGDLTNVKKHIWGTLIMLYAGAWKDKYDAVKADFILNGPSNIDDALTTTLIESMTRLGATKLEDTSGGIKSNKSENTAEYGEIQYSLIGNFESTLLNAIEANIDELRTYNGSKIVMAFIDIINEMVIIFSPISYNHNESFEGGAINIIKINGEKTGGSPNDINIIVSFDSTKI